MDNNIQNYRQPMVTAIGIILGFTLGFTGKWATEPVVENKNSDYFIFAGLLLSIVLMITSLYRILNNNHPLEKVAEYYKKTLNIFITGLVLSFISIFISILEAII